MAGPPERKWNMKFAKAVVKNRIIILIAALLLMIPSVLGYAGTRVNYEMLNYLPEDMETVKGQNELLEGFGKGAFSFIIVEDMQPRQVADLKEKIQTVDHVESVLWYDSIMDLSVPMEMLPEKIYKAFNSANSTMLAVFFDSSTSADMTMEAIRQIRRISTQQCYISGMSALVTDLKDLCEKEEPIYVALAVACALAAMLIFLDSWLIPFIFLMSMPAVTMDYSIFLWHSYTAQLAKTDNREEAMENAIGATLTSVIGSSVTTIAGFIALCFMSFTMGRDLGIVMAKGVVLGVLGCVTVLPAMILMLHKPLIKSKHRPLIPQAGKLAGAVVKFFPVFLVLFALVIPPAYAGYTRTNGEVYYDMANCLPQDMPFVTANKKLQAGYDVASTHMVLVSSDTPSKDVRAMIKEMEQVNGVKYVLGLESVVGPNVPEELLPQKLTETLKNDKWELLLINSEYHAASDAVNAQIDSLNSILKKYDKSGMLIGEAPCMKDMIETTDHDFKVVNAVSILAIFVIIALVEKSLSLPFILIAVIETAIFINLGLPHYLGQSLPFIAPICISTIQLGATVDYAILMTTRYKTERLDGADKRQAVKTALAASIPSIVVSGAGLFAATFGVAVYSDIDIISSMCMLMARGAVISMVMVIFALPPLLLLLDRVVCATTAGMRHLNAKHEATLKTAN